jgi:hypothetical protein
LGSTRAIARHWYPFNQLKAANVVTHPSGWCFFIALLAKRFSVSAMVLPTIRLHFVKAAGVSIVNENFKGMLRNIGRTGE